MLYMVLKMNICYQNVGLQDQLFKAGCWKSRAFRLDCWLSENAAYLPEGWKDIRDKRTQEWASSISEAVLNLRFRNFYIRRMWIL